MELWMAYGLFDNGSGPDVGFTGFPYAAEDKIRVEHPEWAPVNKYGTWHQGGPIEFCYEGARKAMVEYLTKYVVEGGYDGIAFSLMRRITASGTKMNSATISPLSMNSKALQGWTFEPSRLTR
jgi:hypothetical protein